MSIHSYFSRTSWGKVFRSNIIREHAHVANKLISSILEYHEWIDICSTLSTSGWVNVIKVQD